MPASEKQIQNMKQKRATILEQALRLFSEYGYYDTTIQKVAKASKVSFGSVFTYFENKEALFHAVVAEPLQEREAEILDFQTDPEHPMEEIERMVRDHLYQFAKMGIYLRLIQQIIGQPSTFAKEYSLLRQFHKNLVQRLALLIQKGQEKGQLRASDAEKTAITYTSFLIGLRLNITNEPDHPVWEQFAPCAVQIFGPIR
ncbi:TetR/AcrR family transcriptional regulator [Xylanibacillus composti]|uniref:TetR family transcriptional regulator n=1 Tax=Xylanibacillus composti TaxID=1572762 RepID=A0A8J4H3Z0_9BACL|nr:TetR/AcrR family transcriptional regulator [Xylanibacillus composti]MDT9725367.1 TetR/AcrR family transcriptional regulator [Xylanibacillus composti]GIQ69131.1 TetR family transcriptional regulator [Xylanibacillus composti]